jgi:putative CocE/NonD family hydrolase
MMPRALCLVLALALGLAVGTASAAAAPTVSVKTLHFDTLVGPNNDTHCDVVGDLYTPSTATAANPAPAILTTNGFGGSKNDQADAASAFAARGYVVLSYSGLGFGGSGCKIELDDPVWDGKAASQLITFLGGGSAAKDGTRVDYVIHDAVAHDGRPHPADPRVGMVGGSYGGQIQFSAAGQDPRLDAIIPIITWNDLSYSLAPNNTSFTKGVTYATPGTEKAEWTSLFFGVGIMDGLQGAQADPSRNVGCPNFDNQACQSKAQMDTAGYPDDTTLAFSRHASVVSYMDHIVIPTLLAQGEADTLFNLNEAVATYHALKAQGTPVKRVWQSWGHSNGKAAPGEFDVKQPPEATYESGLFLQWFDHYLKGTAPAPALDFTYFRDWVKYTGNAVAAYGEAPSYPVGTTQTFHLSGTDALVPATASILPGTTSFATPAAGAPSSYSETSAVEPGAPPSDPQGTYAAYTSEPLSSDLVSVGIPTLDVRVSAPAPGGAAGPAGQLVLFVKLYDVGSDGSIELVHRLISPVRVADPSQTLHITLPGVAHMYRAGHRIRLVIAGGDAAYKGNNAPTSVSITADPTRPYALTLPVLPSEAQRTAAAPQPSPALGSSPACPSRRRKIRIRGRHRERIKRATVLVDGQSVQVIRGRRLRTRIDLRRFPPGIVKVRTLAVTRSGRRVIRTRTYSTCTKRAARRRHHRRR